ncbi:NuA3 HAT complex component NTO1, partial [Tremellales sp. Uapishka_1]
MPALEASKEKAHVYDIPKVSFRVVDDDKTLLVPAGVHSEQSRSYGYNDFSDFTRPEHYIRYIGELVLLTSSSQVSSSGVAEPIESELAVQVEYDMDEQDQEWLDAINAERKKDQSGPISYEVFEIIMDKLEKEWFDLIKRIPQPASHLPVEDSKCSICDDGEGENSNAIVFCDGCNLAVHQDCYGVPYIPEGQWLCRKCTVSPENPVSCLLCPNEGGAFKQTSTGHWCHLLCAIWIPELGVGNAMYMEPVEGVESIPKNRWKLICSLCKERVGACIQCENRNCFTAFHVTCARQMGLLMTMKTAENGGILRCFCDKHLPAHSRDDFESETASNLSSVTPAPRKHRGGSVGGSHNPQIAVTTKSARAHAKSYRPGPPIVPGMILKRLYDYVQKVQIRKRQPFVERLCRYWSLKREARRGAPLLKRLHLEPWTASNASKQETEAEKAKKMQLLIGLRTDLEKVRMLAELVRKREREKLRQAQVLKDIVDGFIFPYYAKLRLTLERISAMDRNEFFLQLVSKTDVPDYYGVVKEPMCWLSIDEKLEKNTYWNVSDFKRDVILVLDNAMLYNAKDTPWHRAADRIKKNAQPLLDELDDITSQSTFVTPSSHQALPHYRIDQVGDLEPSSLLLETLLGHDEEDPDRDRLAGLFAFEMEKPRPPT